MGEAAPIGAVGIGATILTSIYWLFGFLRMGTIGLTSQAMGMKDLIETQAILSRSLIIGLGGGAVLILVQIPLFSGAFWVSPASDEVESLARDYMVIRIWSAPCPHCALRGVGLAYCAGTNRRCHGSANRHERYQYRAQYLVCSGT